MTTMQHRAEPAKVDPALFQLKLPTSEEAMDQDKDWCRAVVDGETRRFRFHDYDEIYSVPGLYEAIFYDTLKCCSPRVVVEMLEGALEEIEEPTNTLRVLDMGAGNGIVAEELRRRNVDHIVGVDIIPEAKEAAERDRPSAYDDYAVADLTALTPEQFKAFDDAEFNCLTLVAALGFDDIPAAAFINAFRFVDAPGWVAFNIKEEFLRDEDQGQFAGLMDDLLKRDILRMHAFKRYCHRLSVSGEKLYYAAIIARKNQRMPKDLIEAYTQV